MSTIDSSTDAAFASERRIISSRLRLAVLLLLLLGAVALSVSVGSVRIPFAETLTILSGGEAQRATWTIIVLKFRLPKAITALLAGAGLAVSGLQMQTLFRNPLAGPFVLGINAGASLGVAIVVLITGTATAVLLPEGWAAHVTVVVAAMVGALVVMLLVMLIARRVETTTLLILGLLLGYATSAVVSILLFFAIAERIQAYIAWTFGSFSGVTWRQLSLLAPIVLLALLVAWLQVKPLNALLLGESYARSLGLAVRRARVLVIISASLLAGAVTAFCGPIGFIGVAVPHMCRALFNSADHRILLPASMLLGAFVALVADIIAQLPGSDAVLPLNAVTALIGAPVVAWVILRRQTLQRAI